MGRFYTEIYIVNYEKASKLHNETVISEEK